MYFEKRYLQFNDLVFDGYDMISSSDERVSYKGNSTPYSFTHGSYRPLKSEYAFVSEGSVSMTLTFHLKKLPCNEREFYVKFADQELGRAGRLWAIKNNEIIWAWAVIVNKHEIINHTAWKLEYDVEFALPEGIWHKADKQKTFVLPYNVCTFMECKGYEQYNPCSSSDLDGDCCETCQDNKWKQELRERCFCCCVDELSCDMALCYHTKERQQFYGCETPFQLVYNCAYAESCNKNPFFGQKLCVKDVCDGHIIAGRIYSDTDLPTENVTVTIQGKMKNPSVTINGNTNVIKGNYDGVLTITPSGDVYYAKDECCDGKLLSPNVWSIPKGTDYGWTVYPKTNSVIIDTHVCCENDGLACAYIYTDEITA